MRKTIGASEGAGIFVLGLCGASILSYLFSALLSKAGAFAGMGISSWVGYAIMQVAFIAVVLIYAKVRKVDEFAVARVRPLKNWKQWLLLPIITIATILVFLPLANAWSAFLGVIGYSGGGVAMPDYSNVGIYFLSLLIMAVVPAIGEELLVRGNLFHGLSTRNVWFGILISALMFSLMHANPVQTVHQFGLGVVLAIVLALSGSIWACVAVHFLNNFISITLTAYLPQVDAIYVQLGHWNWLTGAASVIVGLIVLVLALYAFYRVGERKDENKFRVVSNGIVYDEFTIYVANDDSQSGGNKKFSNSGIVKAFSFLGSLFTKRGWAQVTRTLESKNDIPIIGKQQPMFSVWLALGIVCVYWVVNFILALI